MTRDVTTLPQIGIIGYGTIGRRLAKAVSLQPDMQLAGIFGRPDSIALERARLHGYQTLLLEDANGQGCTGSSDGFSHMLASLDVILDCTPSGTPERYRHRLAQVPNLTTIVQGGEAAGSCDTSFNSMANYSNSHGKRRIRVISCSSTGTTRLLWALEQIAGIDHAYVTLIRRGADPGKLSKVPIHSLLPTPGPSHHAGDVNTVLPKMSLFSVSVDCPTTLSHVIWFHIQLTCDVELEEILLQLDRVPRIIVGFGLQSTVEIAAHFNDLGRFRHDHPELYVFGDTATLHGSTLTVAACVHMESITIPETIDCIRAALGMQLDAWDSMRLTDKSLGIDRPTSRYQTPLFDCKS